MPAQERAQNPPDVPTIGAAAIGAAVSTVAGRWGARKVVLHAAARQQQHRPASSA